MCFFAALTSEVTLGITQQVLDPRNGPRGSKGAKKGRDAARNLHDFEKIRRRFSCK